MNFDWVMIAAIVTAIATVASVMITRWSIMRAENKEEKTVVDQLNLRLTTLEVQIKNLSEHVELLRKKIENDETRDIREFERIENKVEKLTDVLIQFIQQDSNTLPKKK